MRVLLLYCHPRPQSFIGALCADALQILPANGRQLDVFDLYAEAFDPVLSAEEMTTYAAASEHAARLRRAEALVAIYPTWWYGPPAMLKGYFERLWAPGVAFSLEGGATAGLLSNIRQLLVITTYGAPRDFIEREIGDPGAAFWLNGVAGLLDAECRKSW